MSKPSDRPVQVVRFQSERMKEICWHVYCYYKELSTVWNNDSPKFDWHRYEQETDFHKRMLAEHGVTIKCNLSTCRHIVLANGQSVNHGILIRAWKAHEMEQI